MQKMKTRKKNNNIMLRLESKTTHKQKSINQTQNTNKNKIAQHNNRY
jgi:hypothetical protein